MAIVGISGSPIIDGNTDRLVQALLEQSGHASEFVNLSTLAFSPCRACAHLCGPRNTCGHRDDLWPWLERVLDADAVVMASPLHGGTVTAWMYSFISRLWCFHHRKNLLEDKPALLVVTGLFQKNKEIGPERFEDVVIRRWGHRMRHLGTIFHATDIPPCYKCGVGNQCKVGGLWHMVDHDEEKLHNFIVTPDKFTRWEDCPRTVAEVKRYAQALAEIPVDSSVGRQRRDDPDYRAEPGAASMIPHLAVRQLADYDARKPGSVFAEGVTLNVEQGYALQTAVSELRQRRGERVIGYKVGCTSPTIREQLGVDHCVSGRLYDTERHDSGAVLSRSDYANLAIEGELAVELSREPTDDDFVGDGIPACVARVFPVIELHHHALRGVEPSAGELIAHNAIHAGFVAARGVTPDEANGEPSLSIHADDRLLGECAGSELIETIRSSLKWLMGVLQERGDKLETGQTILTGSIPSLIPIDADCRVRVDAPPFGAVEASIGVRP